MEVLLPETFDFADGSIWELKMIAVVVALP